MTHNAIANSAIPRHAIQHACGIILLCVLALTPYAALSNNSDDGFVLNREGKKFFALTPSRPTITQANRSDSGVQRQRFFKIDRAASAAAKRIIPSISASKDTNTTNDAKVLTLFDAEGQTNPRKSTSLFSGNISRVAGAAISHIWPIAANVAQKFTSGYGMRNDPFHGRRAFHGGIDIAAAMGTPILATANGIVKEAGSKGGYGNYVLLSHSDGTQTMYNHLQSSNVRVGNAVRAGQSIGALGSTGRSTGPHLDYRLIVAGQKKDPMTVLAGKQPRGLTNGSTAVASRGGRVQAQITNPSIRMQSGVRIITPRERLAQAGGFIRVR